jgi:hypothetical protein
VGRSLWSIGAFAPRKERVSLRRLRYAAIVAVLAIGITDVESLAKGRDVVTEKTEQLAPVYAELKELHLETELVRNGEANVTIVASDGTYGAQAERIRETVEALTGVRLPIAADDSRIGTVPIEGNLILLGNRSTNRLIGELYNRYYCLLDLRYPGPGGHVVRSLHNPFGNGRNIILIGGSDVAGVEAATEAFIEKLSQEEGTDGRLAVGWLMEIELNRSIRLPEKLEAFETWEASAGYGSIGYFGWNSISKRMAMYYMTGDPFHAREVVRLAFPDEQAKAEIAAIDGERIENKDEPLSGPYHYNAHMMILFWDLIEESPVFSAAERLQVTNAFARQLFHAEDQGWRREIRDNALAGREDAYDEPPPHVGSRHGQWSAISLYCLGRYFNTYYPDPLWRHCIEAAKWHFSSLHRHAWVGGENDNLYWYNTGVAPILSYMLLTGDRVPMENGVFSRLLRGQDILASGEDSDWALRYASIGYLHKAAYFTGEGRYLEYLRRTGIDLEIFRLGQSFWPEMEAELPEDLVGEWNVQPIPEPMWRGRDSGLPHEESFLFGSFRSAADDSGDRLLIKGMNGESRNPYHTFAVLAMRLDGVTVLDGFLNQVLTRSDGLVEPQVAMDAALRHRDVVGRSAVAVAEVPHAAYCSWRRSVVQRVGRYGLFVDDLEFRTDSDGMEVEILWQGKGDWQEDADGGAVRIEEDGVPFAIRLADPIHTRVRNRQARMEWLAPVRTGERKLFFSLVARERDGGDIECARLADNAAVLGLPEPAVVAVGEYEGLKGDLVLLAGDHLHGVGLSEVNIGAVLFAADGPVSADWDFAAGVLEVVADGKTRLRLGLEDSSILRADGEAAIWAADGSIQIAAGRHTFSGARPEAGLLEKMGGRLADLLKEGREMRTRAAGEAVSELPEVPELATGFSAGMEGEVADLAVVASAKGTRICAAAGTEVLVLSGEGGELRRLRTDGDIRVLRWWPEAELLLVGCVDEQVIAFDIATGERRWSFTSEMDAAVWRAAKTYWFKSAPGHEGIHGLHTGTFLNGESQAFVGSACTLEILDMEGGLVERLPVFWGPGTRFALIDGPEESTQLLIARQPTDSHRLAVVDNRNPDPKRRSFDGVPPGHANIGGWACMSRKHIFYEDMAGEGEKVVVSEINGTWNRVTVWAEDGTPLHSANFGPGESIPAQNVTDLDVGDLNGDGKKEIVAALASGYVIALDYRCERVWAEKLAHPPAVLQCIDGEIWVGCEDGTLLVLDGAGEVVRRGKMEGRPTRIERLGNGVLLGTAGGGVRWLKNGGE